MRIVAIAEQAQLSLEEWLDEVEMLNGPEVVSVREDQFMMAMYELAGSPEIGDPMISEGISIGVSSYPVRGGYVVYDVTETELRVAMFVRDDDMPEVMALLTAPVGRPQ